MRKGLQTANIWTSHIKTGKKVLWMDPGRHQGNIQHVLSLVPSFRNFLHGSGHWLSKPLMKWQGNTRGANQLRSTPCSLWVDGGGKRTPNPRLKTNWGWFYVSPGLVRRRLFFDSRCFTCSAPFPSKLFRILQQHCPFPGGWTNTQPTVWLKAPECLQTQ